MLGYLDDRRSRRDVVLSQFFVGVAIHLVMLVLNAVVVVLTIVVLFMVATAHLVELRAVQLRVHAGER